MKKNRKNREQTISNTKEEEANDSPNLIDEVEKTVQIATIGSNGNQRTFPLTRAEYHDRSTKRRGGG